MVAEAPKEESDHAHGPPGGMGGMGGMGDMGM
jgi:chaperonin GroEL